MMKNLCLYFAPFLTIFLLTNCAWSQNASRETFLKVAIGVNFSPDINYRTLINNNDGNISTELVIAGRNETESPLPTFTTGLTFATRLHPRIGFELGVQYAQKGYQVTYRTAVTNPPADPYFEKFRTIDKFSWLETPVKFQYYIPAKKVRYFVGAGVTTQLLLKAWNHFITKSGGQKPLHLRDESSFEYNAFNLAPSVSVGMDYPVNDQVFLRLEPNFKYQILKVIDAPISAYFWNVGLNLGIFYGK